MIDIKFLRENPEVVKENIKKKFQDHKLPLVDEVIELDAEARKTQQEADALRADRNKLSKQIGALMGQGKKEEAEEVKKKRNGLITGKVFSIIGVILGFVMTGVCIYLCFLEQPMFGLLIPLAVLGVGIGVGLIVLLVKVINPKIKLQTSIYEKLLQQIKELENLASAQMAPLNALYDWNIPTTIIEKVIPILDFDKYFDGSKYFSLIKNYGFAENIDVDKSTLFVQSGTILGNPFLVQKCKVHSIYNKAYTGSITISWTETY